MVGDFEGWPMLPVRKTILVHCQRYLNVSLNRGVSNFCLKHLPQALNLQWQQLMRHTTVAKLGVPDALFISS